MARAGDQPWRDWVACVANFSEGRSQPTIASLQEAIASVANAHLLDTHIDADHNRCVLTFAAPPAAVSEAAYRAIATASERIDLRRHRGAHPRIGAADVIPFVPLLPEQMPVCVEIARSLARQVGEQLAIPVYCYGEAALHPQNRRLEIIRRGQYEGLRGAIQQDPARAPDFGPAKIGPAGATAIGARGPLIAFNVYLKSDNIQLARDIARSIRASSGGLPAVKALGLLIGGRAQVSMNLTDFRQTPIRQVIAAIEKEAARAGVCLDQSELVGLAPRAAVIPNARAIWRLPEFGAGHILEERIAALFQDAAAEREVAP